MKCEYEVAINVVNEKAHFLQTRSGNDWLSDGTTAVKTADGNLKQQQLVVVLFSKAIGKVFCFFLIIT